MPVSSGRRFSNCVNASRPPADAPMPTIGNDAVFMGLPRLRTVAGDPNDPLRRLLVTRSGQQLPVPKCHQSWFISAQENREHEVLLQHHMDSDP
jgi:hypothetical protein